MNHIMQDRGLNTLVESWRGLTFSMSESLVFPQGKTHEEQEVLAPHFDVPIGMYVACKCTGIYSCGGISIAPLAYKRQLVTLLCATNRMKHHKMGLTHNDASTIKVGVDLSNYLQPIRCINIDCSVGLFLFYGHKLYVGYYC